MQAERLRYVVKTLQGLEPVLAEELRVLGADEVEQGCRMVTFVGDQRMMYRANYFLRTALRVLKPLFEFEATTPEEVYAQCLAFDWEEYLSLDRRFSIDSVVNSELFTHSRFVALRMKDAIVDQFRNRTGRRPFVDPENPDVRFHLHIQDNRCSVLLDSSGASLHMRGYRQRQELAPLNEVLAAGMILLSGWDGVTPFMDPMCGSGTLLIEAALIAHGIAPGVFRKRFGFESWPDFDSDLLEEIAEDESYARETDVPIVGSDISTHAVESCMHNLQASGVKRYVTLSKQSVFDVKSIADYGVMVTNPPYGERIKQVHLDTFYGRLSDSFKQNFTGWDIWMISGNKQAMKHFALHPSVTHTLFNGALECKYQRFSMYAGSLKGTATSEEPQGEDYVPSGMATPEKTI